MSGRRTTVAARRALHPLAWWAWACAMAVCAIKTTNPFLLAVIAAVVVYVVMARRSDAPWARSFGFFVRMGLFVIAIRVVIEILFGQRGLPGYVLFSVPQVSLPHWAEGVSIGGPVTLPSILGAALVGFQLAVILMCFGAANSLANPYHLLRSLPAVLYEAGVAVTVALSFAPELVITIANVREARRLRGRPNRGVAGLRGMAVPVLEGALDRSLQLASSMDARGYGRRNDVSSGHRRLSTALLVTGLLAVVVGLYGVLDAAALHHAGLPLLAFGMALCALSLLMGGRRTSRTRYRPDPWRAPEWVVLGASVAAVAGLSVAEAIGTAGISYSFQPLAIPDLPLLALLGILCGLIPGLVAPRPMGALSTAPTLSSPDAPGHVRSPLRAGARETIS